MRIRKATFNDADGIAKVHVDSWKTTYKGIISDSFLTQLSKEKRKKSWEWTFNNLNPDEEVFLAVNDKQEIIGFSNGGRSRNEEFEHDGELYAIYLLKEYQGKGIGKVLFQSVMDSLSSKGYTSMMLWVLQGNNANGFYQAMNGELIGQKDILIGEERHTELAYGWRSITAKNCE